MEMQAASGIESLGLGSERVLSKIESWKSVRISAPRRGPDLNGCLRLAADGYPCAGPQTLGGAGVEGRRRVDSRWDSRDGSR